ncbi:MAG TPA: methyltransferase domain-containing protein [Candidatus Eisenbacteria bacterium]|nr:methyltransferase domain-containing protein [Candidatus Eisenbacteria bacterium]
MPPAEKSSVAPTSYMLGHSERELARLTRQAMLVNPMTRRYFKSAGIAPGMRVLDVGSGPGDTAILAAELVGPTGRVVGVDRSPVALGTARSRVKERSLDHVSFHEGELGEVTLDGPFDAVVGRYVLMFQPDPVALLRALTKHLKPEGIVVFHEVDWDGVRTYPAVPLFEEASRWITDAAAQSGADCRMGIKLHDTYLAAGLPAPDIALEALIGSGADLERIRFITEIVETMADRIEELGIATAAEMDIGTLDRRIAAQALAVNGVMAGRSEIGAWCRREKP